jgi:hypothetical protein
MVPQPEAKTLCYNGPGIEVGRIAMGMGPTSKASKVNKVSKVSKVGERWIHS